MKSFLKIAALLILQHPSAQRRQNPALMPPSRGSYAVQLFGVPGNAEPFEPVNVVRTAIFDGKAKGTFTGAGWRSEGGVTTKFTTSGKYSVKKDCSVTIDGTFAGGASNIQFGLIADSGNKIIAIRTDAGQIVSITYEKQ